MFCRSATPTHPLKHTTVFDESMIAQIAEWRLDLVSHRGRRSVGRRKVKTKQYFMAGSILDSILIPSFCFDFSSLEKP